MRVVYVGSRNPRFRTIIEYTERALEREGCEYTRFDDRAFLLPGRIRDAASFLQNWDQRRLNRNLLALAGRFKPDLCLVHGGYRILPETLRALKERKIATMLWTVDAPIGSGFEALYPAAPLYDHVFCGGSEAIELLGGAGIANTRLLPFACDPEFHKQRELTGEEKARYGCEVAFVGSLDPALYANRLEMLESLAKLPALSLGVWGPAADRIPRDSPLKRSVRGLETTPETWTGIYSAAKIVLCMHYRDPQGKTPCYQASPRVYEALACRAFLLVDRQRDVEALFEDRKHLVFFDSQNDLKGKIAYYLAHPGERAAIAEAGYREVTARHTYLHRIREALSFEPLRSKTGEAYPQDT